MGRREDIPVRGDIAMTLPATFNFAQHLLDANAARADKTAYIDDHGVLSYGARERPGAPPIGRAAGAGPAA